MLSTLSHARFISAIVAAVALSLSACGVGQSPDGSDAPDDGTVSAFMPPECDESGCPGGGGEPSCIPVDMIVSNTSAGAATVAATYSVSDGYAYPASTTNVTVATIAIQPGETRTFADVACLADGAEFTSKASATAYYGATAFRSTWVTASSGMGRVRCTTKIVDTAGDFLRVACAWSYTT